MRNILIIVLTCCLILVAGISNAETVTLTAPSTYTDGAPIGATVDVLIRVYTAALCGGTLYTSGNIKAGAMGPLFGGPLNPGTYAFSANAEVGTGGPSGCSASVPYTYAAPVLASVVINGEISVNESTTATYTATATMNDNTTKLVTPTWSVTPTTYASIDAGGVLTTGVVFANQTVIITASYIEGGITKTATLSVTIVNSIITTTPGAPAIGTITR